MPGQVGAAAKSAFAFRQVDGKAACPRGRASAVEMIENERVGVGDGPHRTLLELIVAVAARANGQREYLRDQIKIDGSEKRKLLVPALHVLAVGIVHVFAKAGIARMGTRKRSDGGQAIRALIQRDRQIGRRALRNAEIIPVEVVVDHELFPVSASECAHAVLFAGADTEFVALMFVLNDIEPGAYGRIAPQRLAGQLREVPGVKKIGASPDAGVFRAGDAAHVVGIVLLSLDVTVHVAAAIDGLQVSQPAIERPGCALVTILRVSRREGSDLVGLQRGAIRVEWIGVEISVRVHLLIALLDEEVPVVVELVESGEPKSPVGKRVGVGPHQVRVVGDRTDLSDVWRITTPCHVGRKADACLRPVERGEIQRDRPWHVRDVAAATVVESNRTKGHLVGD